MLGRGETKFTPEWKNMTSQAHSDTCFTSLRRDSYNSSMQLTGNNNKMVTIYGTPLQQTKTVLVKSLC